MRDEGLDAARLGPSLIDGTYIWFLRVVGVYCMLFGVLYWVRLVGFYDDELWRFDLMPTHWRVAASSLAVLFPVAGVGLWMLASWGPVIWFLCAAGEAVMYAGYPELFGAKAPLVLAHGLVAVVFIAFRVALHFEKRRRSR